MKKLLTAVALLMLASAPALAAYKGAKLTAELKKDLTRRQGNAGFWRTKIGGKAGDAVRPWSASSVRTIGLPHGGQVHGGMMLKGTIRVSDGNTTIDPGSYVAPRGLPAPAPH